MATPDTRPTINLGTRYRAAKGTAARAAATVRAGEARTEAESVARSYRRRTAARANDGYGARTRRRRNNPSPTAVGPAAAQFRDVEY